MLRVIRVCRLASNVCSSELEPGEQQSVTLPRRCDTFWLVRAALTRIQCLASAVRCINYYCCSPSHSHHSLQQRTFPPQTDCASSRVARLQTHPGRLCGVRTHPQMNKRGWGNLCQSGRGQDGQKTRSSSWWHSECPSLWQNESWRGDKMQRDPVRSLLALIPIFVSTWV